MIKHTDTFQCVDTNANTVAAPISRYNERKIHLHSTTNTANVIDTVFVAETSDGKTCCAFQLRINFP